MKTGDVDALILDIANRVDVGRYSRYMTSIAPRTPEDLFRTWLFAYASIHTTWELNCRLYRMLADFPIWLGDDDKLKEIIIASRAGLHNNRTRYISTFARFYWDHPDWFWKNPDEQWTQYRDRIKDKALGVGPAKSSFVVEITYPDTAAVLCTDTHILQLGLGIKPAEINRVTDKQELALEAYWVETCRRYGVPSPIARWAYWDQKKGSSDSRYWAHVLEKVDYHERFRVYGKSV